MSPFEVFRTATSSNWLIEVIYFVTFFFGIARRGWFREIYGRKLTPMNADGTWRERVPGVYADCDALEELLPIVYSELRRLGCHD